MKITIKYYYKYPKKMKSIIQCSIMYEGKRVQLSTGISVEKKDWDEKISKVKKTDSQVINKNQILKSIDASISEYYFKQKALNEDVSANIIKEIFYNAIQVGYNSNDEEPAKKPPTLIESYEQYLKEKSESGKFSSSTIYNNRNCFNHFKAFSRFKMTSFDWDNLNKKFFDDFLTFLINKQNLTNNSAKKLLKHFKTFWNSLNEDSIPNYHKISKFINQAQNEIKSSNNDFIVALSQEELNLIQEYKSDNIRLMKVRDLFLLQTYLGVRISDLINIKPSNIDRKNGVIHINMIKTKDYISIPIFKKVEAILDKYPGGLPKFSEKKYRDYIKELCKILGIDEPINQQKIYGSRVVNEVLPKWQLISSHTARRTFITLSLKNGVLPEHIMKITGHRSRADFQKYVRITEKEAHQALKSVWDE